MDDRKPARPGRDLTTGPIASTLLIFALPVLGSSVLQSLMGLVNSYGSHTAAAYGVAAQLWTYIQMPALAIGAAVSSMAAQNVGARRWDRIGKITGSGIGFNLVLTGALVAILFLFDRSVLSLFLADSPAAIETAVHINNIASWSFILFGVTIVIFATVRATGAVMPPLIVLAISLLLVRTGFAYGSQSWLGADALWWSFPVGSICSLALALAYFRFGRWRSMHMLNAERPAAGEPPDTGLGVPRQRAMVAQDTVSL